MAIFVQYVMLAAAIPASHSQPRKHVQLEIPDLKSRMTRRHKPGSSAIRRKRELLVSRVPAHAIQRDSAVLTESGGEWRHLLLQVDLLCCADSDRSSRARSRSRSHLRFVLHRA